MIRSMISKLH
jgi:hypothetical protein